MTMQVGMQKKSFGMAKRLQRPAGNPTITTAVHPVGNNCWCICHRSRQQPHPPHMHAHPQKLMEQCECKCNIKRQNHNNEECATDESGLYAKPRLNTLLGKAEEIEAVRRMRAQPIRRTVDLTPLTKQAVLKKMTEKMNFLPEETVYKNLVPLNVNELDLQPNSTTCSRKKYIQTGNRLPEPEFDDFVKPVSPLKIKLPEAEFKLPYVPPKFDNMANYEAAFGHSSDED